MDRHEPEEQISSAALQNREPEPTAPDSSSHDDDWEIVPEGMQDGGRLRPQQHEHHHEYDHEHQHEHIIFRKQFDINLGWGDWKHKLMSVDWKQYYKVPEGQCEEQVAGTAEQNEQSITAAESKGEGAKKEIEGKNT